jgi:hypothetical protein
MEENVKNEVAKGITQIGNKTYDDVLKPALQSVGATLGNIVDFLGIATIPLKFWSEKVRLNFAHRLEQYKQKLDSIPEEKRCEVLPEIGIPALQALPYTTNDDVAELFTNLLINASNIDMVQYAHPSFTEMIKRLSPDEARIVKFLKGKTDVCYSNFKGYAKNGSGFKTIFSHVTLLADEIELNYPSNENAYMSNLISLGILSDQESLHIIDQTDYNKIKDKINLDDFQKQLVPNLFKSIEQDNHFYHVTDFGKLFINACVK